MTCQECEELSGAYVLGALSPEEREEVETHLAECPQCTQLIQELQGVANILPLAVPEVAPAPAVKERLFAAVRAEAVTVKRPIWRTPPRQKPWQRWGLQLVAAAAIFFLILSGILAAWNLSLQHQLAQLTPVGYAIHGTVPETIQGQFTYLPQQQVTILTLRGLPALNRSEIYQGWVIQGKQPKSIGLLTIQNGTGTLSFQGDARAYDAVAISREPGPQASKDAPQGPIVAQGTAK